MILGEGDNIEKKRGGREKRCGIEMRRERMRGEQGTVRKGEFIHFAPRLILLKMYPRS